MGYRGQPLAEALKNLEAVVKEKLSKEGLERATFRATEVISQPVGIVHDIFVPDDFTVEQKIKVFEIVGTECRRFLEERYRI